MNALADLHDDNRRNQQRVDVLDRTGELAAASSLLQAERTGLGLDFGRPLV
jgi:hypothetical protein